MVPPHINYFLLFCLLFQRNSFRLDFIQPELHSNAVANFITEFFLNRNFQISRSCNHSIIIQKRNDKRKLTALGGECYSLVRRNAMYTGSNRQRFCTKTHSPSFILKMQIMHSTEASVHIYKSPRRHVPDVSILTRL